MTEPAPPTAGAPRPAPAPRARMLPYALWQLRDYVWERGLPTILIAGLFGFIGAMPIRAIRRADLSMIPAARVAQYGSPGAAQQAMVANASVAYLRGAAGSIVFLGAVLAMHGLVANDRRQGFYRFVFSKPVSPARYYGQAFLIHALGFAGALLVLAAIWSALVAPVPGSGLFVAMVLVYLCYAGIAFLLTAAARYDWVSLVGVTLVSQLLWSLYGEQPRGLARLVYLLPPIPRVDEVYAAAVMDAPLPWRTLGWLAGYGIACFLSGLVVLRHRRLAIP